MTPIEGKISRVDGPVRFRPGFRYAGFGRTCRVEIVPALGEHIEDTSQTWLQYVTYRPGRWFVFFAQLGEYYWAERWMTTEDIGRFVDVTAFQWRQRKTHHFWVRSPFDIWDNYTPGDPFFFDFDYNQRSNQLTPKHPGFVYLVEAVDLGRVRIGWTANPDRRPAELVRHSPSPLNLLALLPGSRMDEAHLQYMLSAVRLHDDWFQLTDQARTLIEQLRQRWRKPGEHPAMPFSELPAPVGDQGVPL